MQNNKEKEGTGDKINDFIQRNRKAIFAALGVIAAFFIGLIVFIAVSEQLNKKAIAEVEVLNEEFETLRADIRENENTAAVNALLEKLKLFAGGKKGFPGSKAWSIIAQIYSSRESWNQAEEAWLNSARAGEKTYIGPIAFFNAAVAAEEQGKIEDAIEYLKSCTAHKFEFSDAPRAQFNIGRLYEQLGNISDAIDSYRALLINFQWERNNTNNPNILFWQNLARNRLIALEVR